MQQHAQVVGLGIAKSIGVSNYSVKLLEKTIKNAKIKPAVNQVESNPFYQQNELHDFCKQHGIILTAYSPFGSVQTQALPGMPVDFHKNRDANKPAIWSNETIKEIADKHKKTVSQILLKIHTGRGITVIPKTINKERLVENADIFDFELDSDDWTKIKALDSGRSCMPDMFRDWVKAREDL